MKIRGLEIKDAVPVSQIIYECAYCSKRFLNKNSYYNHIDKKFCWAFFIDYEQKAQEYENRKITKTEYYSWCYEHGFEEFLSLDKTTKEELGDELFEKIKSLYDDYEDDY